MVIVTVNGQEVDTNEIVLDTELSNKIMSIIDNE